MGKYSKSTIATLFDSKKINCLKLDYTVYLIPMFNIKWIQMYL